eukprot:29930-Pelagococcus_subviridis.AAC.2
MNERHDTTRDGTTRPARGARHAPSRSCSACFASTLDSAASLSRLACSCDFKFRASPLSFSTTPFTRSSTEANVAACSALSASHLCAAAFAAAAASAAAAARASAVSTFAARNAAASSSFASDKRLAADASAFLRSRTASSLSSRIASEVSTAAVARARQLSFSCDNASTRP